VAILALQLPARAGGPVPGFEAANTLYYEGKFAEAASAYEKLAQPGQASPALFFNLGNAFFKSGQIGRAIAAYRQAEALTPRDPDVRANLQFARNQVQGPTLSASRWQHWLARLTLNEWSLLAAAALWLWFLLLALLQWRPALNRPLRGYVAGLGLGTLFLCVCLAANWRQNRSASTAIVIAPDAVVHHGPLEASPNAFTVHDGAELRILDEKDDWLQVSTDPQRVGWIRRDQMLRLGS
jgi:tetratricopeptide (TPR) repeat protein